MILALRRVRTLLRRGASFSMDGRSESPKTPTVGRARVVARRAPSGVCGDELGGHGPIQLEIAPSRHGQDVISGTKVQTILGDGRHGLREQQ